MCLAIQYQMSHLAVRKGEWHKISKEFYNVIMAAKKDKSGNFAAVAYAQIDIREIKWN